MSINHLLNALTSGGCGNSGHEEAEKNTSLETQLEMMKAAWQGKFHCVLKEKTHALMLLNPTDSMSQIIEKLIPLVTEKQKQMIAKNLPTSSVENSVFDAVLNQFYHESDLNYSRNLNIEDLEKKMAETEAKIEAV